jgi:hypothetical protein
MLVSLLFGGLFALSGVAMGLGCWYAWRALHPGREADRPTDG